MEFPFQNSIVFPEFHSLYEPCYVHFIIYFNSCPNALVCSSFCSILLQWMHNNHDLRIVMKVLALCLLWTYKEDIDLFPIFLKYLRVICYSKINICMAQWILYHQILGGGGGGSQHKIFNWLKFNPFSFQDYRFCKHTILVDLNFCHYKKWKKMLCPTWHLLI